MVCKNKHIYCLWIFLFCSCISKPTQGEEKELSAADYYNQGIIDYNNRNFENSLTNFEKAISIDSTVSDFYLSRGALKEFLNDTIGGIYDYKRAILLDSLNYVAYNNIGAVITDDSLALVYYNKCKEIAPDYYPVYHNIAIACFDLKKYKLALENLSISFLHNYDLRSIDLYYAGLIAKETGQLELAKKYFKEAAAMGNNNAEQELLKCQ